MGYAHSMDAIGNTILLPFCMQQTNRRAVEHSSKQVGTSSGQGVLMGNLSHDAVTSIQPRFN